MVPRHEDEAVSQFSHVWLTTTGVSRPDQIDQDQDQDQDPSPPRACLLSQETPGCLALVALQLGVDDAAGGATDGQLLPGLHLVTEV